MSDLSPWFSLVAIIWLQSISGTNTDFPAYSSHLKSRLGITQVQLNNLAVASDAGKVLGLLSGIFARHLPLWSVLIVGTTVGFVGYGVQFLFLADKVETLSYWQFILLQVLAGNSICWVNTVCYTASMRRFPEDYGVVIGLVTSYSGLSAKIYVALLQTIQRTKLAGDKNVYLLLNCCTPLASSVLTAPLLLRESESTKSSGNSVMLLFVFVIAGLTGSYAIVETLVPALTSSTFTPTLLLVMVGLVAVVPLLRFCQRLRGGDQVPVQAVGEGEASGAELVDREITGDEVAAAEEEGEEAKDVRREYSVWKLASSSDFWMYYLVYLCGGTLGLVYSNNLGQIAESRSVPGVILLSIFSSFGFYGKLSTAPLSLYARNKYMSSRPMFIAFLMAPMASSFFLLLSNSKISLLISTAIIGTCTGAITSIAVSMTSDLFGYEHFSVNHNIVITNIPVGSLLFGYIAARIYDHEGGSGGEGAGVCLGVHCYRMTFLVWGWICSMGTILSFVLYIRTRRFPISTIIGTS
ncbi:protein NUCLEAR FUSION DEFECTIVE 4-like [Iris pallida]|uniref:Protein NUCLEAR FUSION DEFECTIVE 4-like n=1 Tax=Iris pallida TaxID=29817 RepID=A0AAX6ER26_IRIPA|nr:protein NUCLEAR FUSION DEFECTIVE 4-like [Iris pallida]